MIRISLARLDKEEIRLEGDEPAEMLELSEARDGFAASSDVHYRLLARKAPGGATVEGYVSVTVKGACGRCLAPVEREIKTERILLYLEAEEHEEEIDLTPDVRSELLLVMPMTLLCREDCAGLCPHCGADRNQKKCRCAAKAKKTAAHEAPEESAWSALDQLKF